MKGTKGGFSTFKGSVKKRNNEGDVYEAEPYEVIRLTDQTPDDKQDVGGEQIYATISETYHGELQNPDDIIPDDESQYQEPLQLQPTPQPQGSDSLRRRTERQKSEMDDVFNYVDELESTEDLMKRRVKFADSEDDESGSSLLDSINAAWNRISRASILPETNMDPTDPTTQSIPEEGPWIGHGQYVYDVPGPPRPVEAYVGTKRGGSADFQVINLSQEEDRRESNA